MGGAGEPTRVQLEDVAASYGRMGRRRTALDGVSLTVEAGEVAAVVGPNGAGKTTLLRIVAGFKRPDRGQCEIAGRLPEEFRRRRGCGYLPEHLVFPWAWSCREVLGRSADLSAKPAERGDVFARCVARSGLDSAGLDKRAVQCSRGTQRRLGLAHALAGDPGVVVLDEPFSGLDAKARAALRQEVLAARDRGTAVLLASHETAEVERLADGVHILEDGRMRPGPSSLAELEAELLREDR